MSSVMTPEEHYPQDFARIEGLAVPQIIHSICKCRATGVLHFIKGDVKKSLYIKDGSIIFATSSEWDDRLGETLIKSGKIGYGDLEEAIGKLSEGRRLGAILADSSAVKPEDLVDAVNGQIKNIIFSLFNWKCGFYKFIEGDLPSSELITLSVNTPDLIFQGIKQVKDFKILLKALGSLKKRFVLGPSFDKNFVSFLEEDERKIIESLKGPSSAEEIQEDSGLDTMAVVRTLVAFKINGIIEEEASVVLRAFLKAGTFRGTLEKNDVLNIIGQLAQNKESGTLYVGTESLQIGLQVKNGVLTGIYTPDEKTSFLYFLVIKGGLERSRYLAKILQITEDESEFMAAIESEFSEEELQEYENQFALQLISDVFRLRNGEFIFIEGDKLPEEGILLEIPLESLIMANLTHIDNWTRVKKGCGEIETILRITPGFLDVMDRITVSRELWDIVSRLQNPLTVREVLATVDMKEFDMCRLLWALQAIGIIKRLEAGEEYIPQAPVLEEAEMLEHEIKRSITLEESLRAEASPRIVAIDEIPKTAAEREEASEEVEEAAEEAVEEKAQEEAVEEDVQIDESIFKEIKKFNEKQRYIYDKVKVELGAGGRNFVNYCKGRVSDDMENPFIDLAIENSGEWNAKALGKRIVLSEIKDCRSCFDRFIDVQVEMVGNLLSKAKQEDLCKGIREIEKRQIEID